MAFTRHGTVAARWLMPFLRAARSDVEEVDALTRGGMVADHFADPTMRISHATAAALIRKAAERDPRLGIRAALQWVPGDFDAFEFASRTAPTLRDAIRYTARYFELIHGGQTLTLREDDELAVWELRETEGVPPLAAVNDYALITAMLYSRSYASKVSAIRAVHVRHNAPTDLADYRRLFPDAEIKTGARHNALIFARRQLDVPMTMAHPMLHAAFDQRARDQVEVLQRAEGFAARVRQELAAQLQRGDPSMAVTAHRFGMSIATLRRRLDDEDASYSDLLDGLRRSQAAEYVLDRQVSMKEVAVRLGFAHVTAFYKAFARWNPGCTPGDFRTGRMRSSNASARGEEMRRSASSSPPDRTR